LTDLILYGRLFIDRKIVLTKGGTMVNIILPDNKRVNVLRIKVTVACKDCGTEWATIINMDGTLKNGWNLCRKCSLDKKFNIVENSIPDDDKKKEIIENAIKEADGNN
jgi:hypothetical protein